MGVGVSEVCRSCLLFPGRYGFGVRVQPSSCSGWEALVTELPAEPGVPGARELLSIHAALNAGGEAGSCLQVEATGAFQAAAPVALSFGAAALTQCSCSCRLLRTPSFQAEAPRLPALPQSTQLLLSSRQGAMEVTELLLLSRVRARGHRAGISTRGCGKCGTW